MKLYLQISSASDNFTHDEYSMALKTVRDHFWDNQQILKFLDKMKPYWTFDMTDKRFWKDYYLDWHVTGFFLHSREDAEQLGKYQQALVTRIYKENGYVHNEIPTCEPLRHKNSAYKANEDGSWFHFVI